MGYKIAGASDSMKDKLSGFIDKIRDAISAVKDFLHSGYEKIKGTFSGGGASQSYSAMPRSVSLARSIQSPAPYMPASIAQTLRNAEIPGYATGQVIPASMKKHLAILGDNNHETEVVSPLSTIRQAQKEALIEALSDLGLTGLSGNNDIPPIILKLFLDSKVVYEAVINQGKTNQMSSGNNDFLLGMT